MPPPLLLGAELLEIVELVILRVFKLKLKMAPPGLLVAELPKKVVLDTLAVPKLSMPPPRFAELFESVELEMLRIPEVKIAPPPLVPLGKAELFESVELEMLRVPELAIPPPEVETAVVELPEIVELLTVRVPELLKPPPLPEVFAPETVTPEMVRLPPVSMLKILKSRPALPLLPLMLSEEAPRPVMVTVPAVPPPLPMIDVLALIMVGNALASVMV